MQSLQVRAGGRSSAKGSSERSEAGPDGEERGMMVELVKQVHLQKDVGASNVLMGCAMVG